MAEIHPSPGLQSRVIQNNKIKRNKNTHVKHKITLNIEAKYLHVFIGRVGRGGGGGMGTGEA